MRRPSRKRFTLMPLIAIAGLSLVVTLPALSATQLHAAKPVTLIAVTVKSGDSLWDIADQRTPPGGDVQATVDAIKSSRSNHLTWRRRSPPASTSTSRSSSLRTRYEGRIQRGPFSFSRTQRT